MYLSSWKPFRSMLWNPKTLYWILYNDDTLIADFKRLRNVTHRQRDKQIDRPTMRFIGLLLDYKLKWGSSESWKMGFLSVWTFWFSRILVTCFVVSIIQSYLFFVIKPHVKMWVHIMFLWHFKIHPLYMYLIFFI